MFPVFIFLINKNKKARKPLIARVSNVGISRRSSFEIAAVVDQTETVIKAYR
jgi:hypothetical protein